MNQSTLYPRALPRFFLPTPPPAGRVFVVLATVPTVVPTVFGFHPGRTPFPPRKRVAMKDENGQLVKLPGYQELLDRATLRFKKRLFSSVLWNNHRSRDPGRATPDLSSTRNICLILDSLRDIAWLTAGSRAQLWSNMLVEKAGFHVPAPRISGLLDGKYRISSHKPPELLSDSMRPTPSSRADAHGNTSSAIQVYMIGIWD